jgi:hypothetical protein
MSSGQQRVQFNLRERVVSDDNNNLQDYVARERNEILRALVQRNHSTDTPGVTVRPTAWSSVVLDGLEAIVDSPGYVMISPGTLAGWTGIEPADPVVDSGFQVVVSDGVSTLDPAMVIVANSGGAPRCDVIEVGFNIDSTTTNESRDIYDEATEAFIPTSIPKTIRSTLIFRVRTGTPGTAPGTVTGWLPLALAIVQPGAALNQVDFYDVRPLLRDIGMDLGPETTMSNTAVVDVHGGHDVTFTGASTLDTFGFYGRVDAEYAGIKIAGKIYQNTPIAATDLANFGNSTGGDIAGVPCNAANAVRGSGFVQGETDTIILVACFPTLGTSTPLPRCVRYSQNSLNNDANVPNPARRRPRGSNGVLMYLSKIQESVDFTATSTLTVSLASTGFGGCVGTAYAIPLALGNGDWEVPYAWTTHTGILQGSRRRDGLPMPRNQLMRVQPLIGSPTLLILPFTPGHDDSGAGALIPSAIFTDTETQIGDVIDLEIGTILCQAAATGTGSVGLHAKITEGVGGVGPVVHVISNWLTFTTTGEVRWTFPLCLILTKGGTLKVELLAYNDAGTGATFTCPASPSAGAGSWGTYRRVRP